MWKEWNLPMCNSKHLQSVVPKLNLANLTFSKSSVTPSPSFKLFLVIWKTLFSPFPFISPSSWESKSGEPPSGISTFSLSHLSSTPDLHPFFIFFVVLTFNLVEELIPWICLLFISRAVGATWNASGSASWFHNSLLLPRHLWQQPLLGTH